MFFFVLSISSRSSRKVAADAAARATSLLAKYDRELPSFSNWSVCYDGWRGGGGWLIHLWLSWHRTIVSIVRGQTWCLTSDLLLWFRYNQLAHRIDNNGLTPVDRASSLSLIVMETLSFWIVQYFRSHGNVEFLDHSIIVEVVLQHKNHERTKRRERYWLTKSFVFRK